MKLPFRPPEGLFEAAIRLFWGLPWAPFLNLEHVEWHGGAVPRSSCQLLFAFEPIWARPPLFLSRPIRPFCWLKRKKKRWFLYKTRKPRPNNIAIVLQGQNWGHNWGPNWVQTGSKPEAKSGAKTRGQNWGLNYYLTYGSFFFPNFAGTSGLLETFFPIGHSGSGLQKFIF